MAIRSLFDDKRRREIRDALRSGRPIFQSRAQQPPPQDEAITQEDKPVQFGESPAASTAPQPRNPARGARKYSPQEQERIDNMLIASIRGGDVGAARTALAAGADVDARDARSVLEPIMAGFPACKSGNTALMIAAGQGDRHMVEMLLDAGADVNPDYAYGSWPYPTALSRARDAGHTDIVELLKSHGARE